LLAGGVEEKIEKVLNGVFLSLDKNLAQKPKKLIAKEYLTRNQEKNTERLSQIQAKVLSKYKTPLPDLWKIFYRINQQKAGYFLINDYQREKEFDSLNIGSEFNIRLVQGYKHQFLSRIT
jgi:hypothetical protein